MRKFRNQLVELGAATRLFNYWIHPDRRVGTNLHRR
jgi:hypothetical protein